MKKYKLLLGRRKYVVDLSREKFNTQFGEIDLKKLKKAKVGEKIKTHKGEEFTIAEPSLIDLLEKKAKRLPQIITPQDAAMILAYTGLANDSIIIDAGAGSGFLSIFLAYYCCKGKVISYEVNQKSAKIAEENARLIGLKNLTIKNKDILQGIDERNVDAVTLDMKDAEENVENAYNALKKGGWLIVYSPYIEQVKHVIEKIEKMFFTEVRTVECIKREWQVSDYTRPKTLGLMHTGWLTFARKF
ncbi:MAG: tRNA (adenine-N1)-methyltransferase [Candidatus Aenigmatarchaeota archaeon]|nr:tRNA (adenine-N1)-methyltransferase [Candidatus Aenigmarchaeota archaeon]